MRSFRGMWNSFSQERLARVLSKFAESHEVRSGRQSPDKSIHDAESLEEQGWAKYFM